LVSTNNEWQAVEGTGWIDVPGVGQINPRRGEVGGGRQYFIAKTANDEYARAAGVCISGGPETWFFEFDDPFFLAVWNDLVLER